MRRVLGIGYSTLWKPSFGPRLAFAPASLVSSGGVASAWGAATSAVGTPLAPPDTVVGGQMLRTTTADKLLTSAGAAGFLHKGPSTVIGVFRVRKRSANAYTLLLETAEGGTVAGYQLRLKDFGTRTLSVRVFDGASWLLDYDFTFGGYGHWIAQKWHVFCVRVSNSRVDLEIDGQFVYPGGKTYSPYSYPTAATGRLAIGGGICDHRVYEMYDSYLSDADAVTAVRRLASTYGVDLTGTVAGDPTLLISPTEGHQASFPYLSRLPSGKLLGAIYDGVDDVVATHSASYSISSDAGEHWTPKALWLANSSAKRYGTPGTSEPLSDGSVVTAVATYSSNEITGTPVAMRATTFGADGFPVWGAEVSLSNGSPYFARCTSAPVEDPGAPGHLHVGVYSQELVGDTLKWSIWDYQSTNMGVTWPTRVRIANGVTDSKRYAEPGLLFDAPGVIYCLIRDADNQLMLQTASLDGGANWAAPVSTGIVAWSSGQSVRKLANGAYVWIGRGGSSSDNVLFYRPPGAGLLDLWQPWPASQLVDPEQGFEYYGGLLETSPGILAMLYTRVGLDYFHANVGFRANYKVFYLDSSMPGSALPSSATVPVGQTRQITCLGAGDYTAVIAPHNSTGSTAVPNALGILYTPGSTNGVDTITVSDLNGYVIGTCTYTVTGN